MGDLMFKELVASKIFPIISVLVGSIFLASCSGGVSRFEMPIFGLSDKENSTNSTSSFSDNPRLARDYGGQSSSSGTGGMAKFRDNSGATSLAARSHQFNSRNSYLPPQTAAPEVRSARYGNPNGASVNSLGRTNAARTQNPGAYGQSGRHQGTLNTFANARPADDYGRPNNVQPMRPLTNARRSLLPKEPQGYNYNYSPNVGSRPVATRRQTRPAVARPATRNGQAITVNSGDTLYSIARHHNVPVMKLMELNKLSDSNLTIGQHLVLPGRSVQAVARPAPSRQTVVKATRSGTYTVRPGESFRAIAARHGIRASELADLNGITDTGSLRPGEVLILPTKRSNVQKTATVQKKAIKIKARGGHDLKVRSVKTRTIKLGSKKARSVARETNKKTKMASLGTRKAASSKAAPGQSSFRWPVRGRIIGKFGPRGDGTHNDGINLAVPNGTQVKAAEMGVVAYAGSELKEYGNLILIRHANDWVSAYAHNDKLMVKRGDKITRGQVVARAGTSGSVERPQVHFELRKGSKPVNPSKYMAGT